jgi:hypothetical protein
MPGADEAACQFRLGGDPACCQFLSIGSKN